MIFMVPQNPFLGFFWILGHPNKYAADHFSEYKLIAKSDDDD